MTTSLLLLLTLGTMTDGPETQRAAIVASWESSIRIATRT